MNEQERVDAIVDELAKVAEDHIRLQVRVVELLLPTLRTNVAAHALARFLNPSFDGLNEGLTTVIEFFRLMFSVMDSKPTRDGVFDKAKGEEMQELISRIQNALQG